MLPRNLRHFRVFLAVADTGSLTIAAGRCHVSQPAVTQALAKLESGAGGALFDRTRGGVRLTEKGVLCARRIRRAIERLDPALAEVAPRLSLTATVAQVQVLIAVVEAQNFSVAARALGLAQPTVHRAVTQLERDAGKPLFERTAHGVLPVRAARGLAMAAQLAFSEIEQADAELAEFDGRVAGQLTVGALPLSRSSVLPQALARFRAERPVQKISVIDGSYDDMLLRLRSGRIDFILGALRDPPPVDDIVQERLFTDHLDVVARPGHPLAGVADVTLDGLRQYGWVVPRPGTPSREQFDAAFGGGGAESILECGSILLMRELLGQSDLLGCISARQAEAEIRHGLLARLDVRLDWPGRAIGLTTRAGWVPTRAQSLLLDHVRAAARSDHACA